MLPPTGDMAHNPGMCPDWESNQRLFGSQASTESTEPHQPGLFILALYMFSIVETVNLILPSPECVCVYEKKTSDFILLIILLSPPFIHTRMVPNIQALEELRKVVRVIIAPYQLIDFIFMGSIHKPRVAPLVNPGKCVGGRVSFFYSIHLAIMAE